MKTLTHVPNLNKWMNWYFPIEIQIHHSGIDTNTTKKGLPKHPTKLII